VTRQVLGIIGGTGIGESFAKRGDAERVEMETPFGKPSGVILRADVEDVDCLFLSRHGEGHMLNPSRVPYRANIFALKALGATQVLATGATGSLREEVAPGELVVADQVIDKTFRRHATFFDEGLVAHVEFAEPVCPRLRDELIAAGEGIDATVHTSGTYVCMEGPQFSTRAESRLHRDWGADLIGMTCMPEAKLAREAEMCYALVALPTDYDCWRPHDPDSDKGTLLGEIMANMRRASESAKAMIEGAIRHLASVGPAQCACHDALELAIWSEKSAVSPAVVKRLEPLIGRYFRRDDD
jgi:5'-methylthioadenosine phosphorylase